MPILHEMQKAVISALRPALLREFEAELCRSRHRSSWWAGANNEFGAAGRMIDGFLTKRGQATNSAGPTQTLLTQAFNERRPKEGLSETTLNQFLNGQANTGGKRDWSKVAPLLLRILLEGNNSPHPVQNPDLVTRICRFFFPDHLRSNGEDADRNRTWFFDRRLRRLDTPVTDEECAAELRAIAYYCGQDSPYPGRGVVVRISGAGPFIQIGASGELNPSGNAMLDCLRSGVRVILVYPRLPKNTEPEESADRTAAEESADKFKRIASRKAGLGSCAVANLIPIDLDLTKRADTFPPIWAGEFMSRLLRFTYFRCEPVGSGGEWGAWSTLIVSRSNESKHGISAFQTDDDELALLTQWLSEFVPQANLT